MYNKPHRKIKNEYLCYVKINRYAQNQYNCSGI